MSMMDTRQPKAWLDRTEGKFGLAFTAVLIAIFGGLGVYFWGTILPWIITMLENTITAVILAGILAFMGMVIFDPRWRNLAFYGYKSAMRAVTGVCIEIDPVGILNTYVERTEGRLGEMDKGIEELGGQIKKLERKIEANENSRQHSLSLMSEAKKHGEEAKSVIYLQARQAGRLQQSNVSYQKMHDEFVKFLEKTKKMRAAAAVMAADMKNEAEQLTEQREMIGTGYKVFTKFRQVMEGGDDERALFNMTKDYLIDDYGMKMGEIETFMDLSKGFIDGVDLENGIYEADALAQLEAWEKKSQNILGGASADGSAHAAMTNVRVEAPHLTTGFRVDVPPAPAGTFDDLFNESHADEADKAKRHN